MQYLDDKTTLVASTGSWIEGEAVEQLRATARLPGVTRVVGMPDLHPGAGHPIGAVVCAHGRVYPHLIGGDIGCGMALFATDADAHRVRIDRCEKQLKHLEGPWDGNARELLLRHGVREPSHESSLGTIGGGNHFAELVRVHEAMAPERLQALGIAGRELLLLVHTGSRGLGETIMRQEAARSFGEGLAVPGPEATRYMAMHDDAVRWAEANRALVADRMACDLGVRLRPILDVRHNFVETQGDALVHRKGAAPHNRGPVVIPGSRGALSYLVEPSGDGEAVGHSLAHGAGRKYTRGDARARMRHRYRAHELRRTGLGSVVICDDKDLLFEEAPDAYKRIDDVVGDLVAAGACRVLATLRPMLTYKTRDT
jgi:release factor H-coupled RctB family protein